MAVGKKKERKNEKFGTGIEDRDLAVFPSPAGFSGRRRSWQRAYACACVLVHDLYYIMLLLLCYTIVYLLYYIILHYTIEGACVAGRKELLEKNGRLADAPLEAPQFFLLKEMSKTPPPSEDMNTDDEFCLCMAFDLIWFMICFSFSAP